MPDRDDRGSVLPLTVLVLVAAVLGTLMVARLGEAATTRARAQAAADAAALAGAAEGREAARQVAAANGARLVSYVELGADAQVMVELGPAQAQARARREHGGHAGEHRGSPPPPPAVASASVARGRAP